MLNAITRVDLSWLFKLGRQAKRNWPERTTCIPPWRNEDRGLWAKHCPVTDTCADRRQQWELSHVYANLIRVDGTLQSRLSKKPHHNSKHSLLICSIKTLRWLIYLRRYGYGTIWKSKICYLLLCLIQNNMLCLIQNHAINVIMVAMEFLIQ